MKAIENKDMKLQMKRSIFNDVIGPLTRGPSSSHTAASYFIGTVARNLLNDEMKSIQISFDKDGSYGKVYKYQNSEFAFLSGLLGISMETPDFFKTPEICKEKGISTNFQITNIVNTDHPNVVELKLTSSNGNIVSLRAKSTGGGTISIEKFNDWDVSIDGQNFELLIEFPSALEPKIRHVLNQVQNKIVVKIYESQNEDTDTRFFQYKLNDEIPTSWTKFLQTLPEVSFWITKPIFFIMKGNQLFHSAEEYLHYTLKHNLTLGEVSNRV